MNRRICTAFIASLVVASGCLSRPPISDVEAAEGPFTSVLDGPVVHDGQGRILPPETYKGTAPTFEQRYINVPHFDLATFPGFEPMIAFDPSGAAYFATFSYPMQTPYAPKWQGARHPLTLAAKSIDAATTWTDASPKHPIPTLPNAPDPAASASNVLHGGDAMIYADAATGEVFLSANAFPCAIIYRKMGDAWSSGTTFCDTQGQVQVDHGALFAGPRRTTPRTGAIVHFCWSGLLYSNLLYTSAGAPEGTPAYSSTRCVRSLDQGASFVPSTPPFGFNDGRCWPFMSQGARTGADGTVYLPQGFCGKMVLAISRDDATTWDVVTVDTRHGASPDRLDNPEGSIAIDRAGNVYYAWIDATMTPRLAISTDQGRTWRSAVPVAAPGINVTMRLTIVAGDAGRVALSYLGTNLAQGVETYKADTVPGARPSEIPRWSAITSITLDALADDPVFASAPANPPEDPVHTTYSMGGVEDYADNDVDPRTGAVWWASGDTCFPAEDLCPDEGGRYWQRPSRGYVAVQVAGTGLLASPNADS